MDETPDNRLREARATFNLDGAAGAPASLRTAVAKHYRAKVFKSGNSMALRLPADLNLEAGTEMQLQALPDGTYTLAKADAPKRKFNIDAIWGIGKDAGFQYIKPEDRVFEHRPLIWDDPEWRAKHMPDE
jgi:antitoxin VapB